jgi:hypothetical protein
MRLILAAWGTLSLVVAALVLSLHQRDKDHCISSERSKPPHFRLHPHHLGLKIVRRPQDAEVIKTDFERGRRMGLDVDLISPEQASRLNPFLKPAGVVMAMRIGDDRYFDPAPIGFARAAATQGATVLPSSPIARNGPATLDFC